MKHVAVIGAGISGLSAAYFLSRKHRVTLYEREARLGGHTNTVLVESPEGVVALDTGFLVHNVSTYPSLVRLFEEIGVETFESDMSFSVSCPTTGFEYGSRGLGGFFAQPVNVWRLAHYRLFFDIIRFNRDAPSVLTEHGAERSTVDDYLRDRHFGAEFVDRYLAPMASAIWSSSLDGIMRFPIQMLVQFMQNHGMLSVGAHPAWRVVRGGSHTYIPRLTAPLGDAIHTGVAPRSVRRHETGVTLGFADRGDQIVDDVVFACPGDEVLPLLADASPTEREVFGQFASTANETWLHTDTRLLPSAPRARAAWNYRLGGASHASPSVTYDLNRLQGLAGPTTYCVTLNPTIAIAAPNVIARFHYRHPRFTLGVLAAQRRWREVSGVRRTHFCGAYWRYGFHEDGLRSAVRVAADFGVHW
jgi:uncharacterized protein